MTLLILALLLGVVNMDAQGIYDFKVEALDGKTFDFATLKGKKILIVNTSSKCGYTKQYKALQEIYEKYGSDKFVIVGFPSNDFFKQEPGSSDEIREFCDVNYKITFPMMAKVHVKGDEMAPIYQWLTQASKNGMQDSKVKWNFQKYLISEDGKLEKVLAPKIKPDDSEIIVWLNN